MAKLTVHDNVYTLSCTGIHKVVSMLVDKGINLAKHHINSDKSPNVQLLMGVDYIDQIVINQRKVYGIYSFIKICICLGSCHTQTHTAGQDYSENCDMTSQTNLYSLMDTRNGNRRNSEPT